MEDRRASRRRARSPASPASPRLHIGPRPISASRLGSRSHDTARKPALRTALEADHRRGNGERLPVVLHAVESRRGWHWILRDSHELVT